MSLRAFRRSMRDAMKARARKARPDKPNAEYDADHLTVCSCPMCGNPRRHAKGKNRLTIQERREDERRNEEVRVG